MAKQYKITDMLRAANERPFITIDDEHTYTVNHSKTNAILLMELSKDKDMSDADKINKMIEIALGKKAAEEIAGQDLSMPAYTLIIETISAAMSLEELETTIEKFQEKKPSKRS